VLYDVPSENFRKGAPSAGGPARTWNSQANDELSSQLAFYRKNGHMKQETGNDSVVFKTIPKFFS
jgi:hypothetical protein